MSTCRIFSVVVLVLFLGACAETRPTGMVDLRTYELDAAFNACLDKARSLGQGMGTTLKESIFHSCMAADYGYAPKDYKDRWLVFYN
jgi:hypothetical protein